MKWFIQYGYRSAGGLHFNYSEAITDEHPVQWLIGCRERNERLAAIHIVFAMKLTDEEAERFDGEVG